MTTLKAIAGITLLFIFGFITYVVLTGLGFLVAAVLMQFSLLHIIIGTLAGTAMVVFYIILDEHP